MCMHWAISNFIVADITFEIANFLSNDSFSKRRAWGYFFVLRFPYKAHDWCKCKISTEADQSSASLWAPWMKCGVRLGRRVAAPYCLPHFPNVEIWGMKNMRFCFEKKEKPAQGMKLFSFLHAGTVGCTMEEGTSMGAQYKTSAVDVYSIRSVSLSALRWGI